MRRGPLLLPDQRRIRSFIPIRSLTACVVSIARSLTGVGSGPSRSTGVRGRRKRSTASARPSGNKTMVNHGLFLREAVERVGWIDDRRYDFYCADGDLALKIWHAGYEIVELYRCAAGALRARRSRHTRTEPHRTEHRLVPYLERWTGIYYDPAKPRIGEWTSLEGVPVRDADRLFPRDAAVDEARPAPARRFTSLTKRLGKSCCTS